MFQSHFEVSMTREHNLGARTAKWSNMHAEAYLTFPVFWGLGPETVVVLMEARAIDGFWEGVDLIVHNRLPISHLYQQSNKNGCKYYPHAS